MKVVVPQSSFIRSNNFVREGLRSVLTALPTHKQGSKKDILMLSSRRSGSTWLMESMGAEPHLRTLNEPFGPKFSGRSILAESPDFAKIEEGLRLHAFPESMLPYVDRYMNEPALTRLASAYNPLAPGYHLKTNRTLWKVIHANPAITYFYERAHLYHTFMLLRHPCPTILSMEKKYEPELGLILANETFCKEHLDDDQYSFFQNILKGGNRLELFAAEWALEQLVPVKELPKYREHIPVLSYEALRGDVARGIAFVAEYCDLSAPEKIIGATDAPSASTADERLKTVQSNNQSGFVAGWRKRMDEATEEKVFSIIRKVGVDTYEPGRDLPSPAYHTEF
ncbi:MAG: hypothetical protein ACPGN3_04550 [Opitutales bacterium]